MAGDGGREREKRGGIAAREGNGQPARGGLAARCSRVLAHPAAQAAYCVAAYLLCAYLVALCYGAWMENMLAVWGVTGGNLARAPIWIRFLYRAHAPIASILASGAALAVLWGLRRALRVPVPRPERRLTGFLCAAGAGILAAGATVGAYRLLDLARFGGMSRDALLPFGMAVLLVYVTLSHLAAEVLLRGCVYALVRRRSRRAALAASALLYAALRGLGNWHVVGFVNATLLGLICCALFERYGSVWPGVALCGAWEYLLRVVAGFPAGAVGSLSALNECYPVSGTVFTGGSAGYQSGLLTTALLLILLAGVYSRSWRRRRSEPC